MSKLSIVVPVYNVEKYVEQCLHSIAGQTLQDIEIIIVNDGSTDASSDICDRFARNDNRVRLINKKNGGLMSAWMEGVLNATSNVIGFVDSDDWVDGTFFEELFNKYEVSNADIVVGSYLYDLPDGSTKDFIISEDEYFGKDRIKELTSLYLNGFLMSEPAISFCRWDKLYKRDLLLKNFKYLNTEISLGEDINTNVAVLPDCNGVVTIKTEGKYHYRFNPKSIANTFNNKQIDNIALLRETLMNIGKDKDVDPNDIGAFIGNMLFEETQKIYAVSMPENEKNIALSSVLDYKYCAEDLKRYAKKKSVFHKIYIWLLTHKHFSMCGIIKKRIGV